MADYVTNTLTLDDGLNIQYLQVGAAPTQGEIEYDGDRDWYAAYLEAGTTYTYELRGLPTDDGTLPDPKLYYYVDQELEVVTPFTNDDWYSGGQFSLNSAWSFTPDTSQMFYIEAGAWSSTFTGTFEIEVYEGGFTPPEPPIEVDTPGTILGIPELICSSGEDVEYTFTLSDPDGFVYYEGPEIYWSMRGYPLVDLLDGVEGPSEVIASAAGTDMFSFAEEDLDGYGGVFVRVDYLDAFGDQTVFGDLPGVVVCEEEPVIDGPPIPGGEGGGSNPPTVYDLVTGSVSAPPLVPVLINEVINEVVESGPREILIDTVSPRDVVTNFSPRRGDEKIGIIEPDGFDFDDITVKTVRGRRRVTRAAKSDVDFIYNKGNEKFYWNANGDERGMKVITTDNEFGGMIAKIEVEDANKTLKSAMFYGVEPEVTL